MNRAAYIDAAIDGWQHSDRLLRLPVNGGSMAPILLRGDRITVERCDGGALRRGDILLVRTTDGALLTHRLIRVASGALHLIGDACADPDPPLPLASLVGRVIARERNGVRLDLRSPLQIRMGALSVGLPLRGRSVLLKIGLAFGYRKDHLCLAGAKKLPQRDKKIEAEQGERS